MELRYTSDIRSQSIDGDRDCLVRAIRLTQKNKPAIESSFVRGWQNTKLRSIIVGLTSQSIRFIYSGAGSAGAHELAFELRSSSVVPRHKRLQVDTRSRRSMRAARKLSIDDGSILSSMHEVEIRAHLIISSLISHSELPSQSSGWSGASLPSRRFCSERTSSRAHALLFFPYSRVFARS